MTSHKIKISGSGEPVKDSLHGFGELLGLESYWNAQNQILWQLTTYADEQYIPPMFVIPIATEPAQGGRQVVTYQWVQLINRYQYAEQMVPSEYNYTPRA